MGRLELLRRYGHYSGVYGPDAKAMLYFGQLQLPAVQVTPQSIGIGALLGLGLVLMSVLSISGGRPIGLIVIGI